MNDKRQEQAVKRVSVFNHALRRIQIYKRNFRSWYWKMFLGSVGKGLKLYGKVAFNEAEHIYIGNNVSINEGVVFNVRYDGKVVISDNVMVSSGVIMNSIGLVFDKSKSEKDHFGQTIIIKSGTWICAGAIITPGITIGENCIIGAGSVVTKNVPDNETWVGVPARFLKNNE